MVCVCWLGTGQDTAVHVYDLPSAGGDALSPQQTLAQPGAITDVSYSRDGKYLAACDSSRNIYLYALPEFKVSDAQILDAVK